MTRLCGRQLRKRKDFLFVVLSFAWLTALCTLSVLLLDAFGQRCLLLNRLWAPSGGGAAMAPQQEFVNLEQLLNSSTGRIRYEPFMIQEPFFISEEDRGLFLANRGNLETLGQQPRERLWGQISVIEDGVAHPNLDCGWRTRPEIFRRTESVQRIHERFQAMAPLLVPQSNTFQHFLDGVVPKIIQGGALLRHPNVTLLLFRPWDRIVEEMLTRLGVNLDQVAYYDGGFYSAKYLINVCNTPPIHPSLWNKARLQLGASEHLQTSFHEAWVVMLIRTKARNVGRHIVNQPEVTSFLEARYGARKVRVFSGSRHLNETVQLFGSARLVIGVHGGAFYNMNFCPRQTAMVEIMPTNGTGDAVPAELAHTIVWKMAQLLGQPYWRLVERPLSNWGHVKVDINKLTRVLDIIDSRQRELYFDTPVGATLSTFRSAQRGGARGQGGATWSTDRRTEH